MSMLATTTTGMNGHDISTNSIRSRWISRGVGRRRIDVSVWCGKGIMVRLLIGNGVEDFLLIDAIVASAQAVESKWTIGGVKGCAA